MAEPWLDQALMDSVYRSGVYCWMAMSDIYNTHLWPYSKSKFNLKSDRVELVAPACFLIYLPNVRAIQYKLGPEIVDMARNFNCITAARD